MSVHSVSEKSADSTPTPRFSRGGKIRAILALGAVVGIGSVLTLAAWTDEGTAVATFSTGSIDIKLNGDDGVLPAGYAFAGLSMSGMKDGSVKYGQLLVNNAGRLDFNYAMATTFTGDTGLASALRITVKTMGAGVACSDANWASGTNAVGPVPIGATFAIASHQLNAGATENLCFRIELPSGSSTGVQNKTVITNLAFTATQLP